jgi:hypothetical protein
MQGKVFKDIILQSLQTAVPKILQALKNDKSGAVPLKATQREANMFLLRKVMTAEQIRDALADVPEGPKKVER